MHFIGFAFVILVFSGIWNFPYEELLWGVPDMTGIPLALGFLVASLWPREVPQDELWAMEVFRAYSRTLGPGLRFSPRLFEGIARDGETGEIKGIRSTREFLHDFDVEKTITKDGIQIDRIVGKLRTRLMTRDECESMEDKCKIMGEENDPNWGRGPVFKNTYVLEQSIDVALKALSNDIVRRIVGTNTFEEIIEKLNVFQTEVATKMAMSMSRWGEQFIQLDITEIIPSKEIADKLKAPFEATKDAEVAVTMGKAAGDAAEAKAGGEAKAITTTATAKKLAAIAVATGEAEARQREAASKVQAITDLARTYGYIKRGRTEGQQGRNLEALEQATNYMLAEEQYRAFSKVAGNGGLFVVSNGESLTGAMAAGLAMVRKGLTTPTTEVPTPEPKAPTKPLSGANP